MFRGYWRVLHACQRAQGAASIAPTLYYHLSQAPPPIAAWRLAQWLGMLQRRQAAAATGYSSCVPIPGCTAAPDTTAVAAAAAALAAKGIEHAAAKVELLAAAGISPAAAKHYSSYLCSPAERIGVRLAFLAEHGALRRPPRLWETICPSDADVCASLGLQEAALEDFRRRHLATESWRAFAARHGLTTGAGGGPGSPA